MENASKALLMAASVLIGVLLMTLMAYVFYFSSDYSSKIKDNIAAKDVYQTNVKFEIYNERNDLNIHDVQTIINLVEDYNKEIEPSNKISLNVKSVSLESELIEDRETTYRCKMSYNNNKKIKEIRITKNP